MPPSRSLFSQRPGQTLWSMALVCWLSVTPAQAQDSFWAFDVAHTHIAENYSWPQSDYHLRLRYEKDGVVALYVHHKEDELRNFQDVMRAGGGKSFELYLDAETHNVVRELHFQ